MYLAYYISGNYSKCPNYANNEPSTVSFEATTSLSTATLNRTKELTMFTTQMDLTKKLKNQLKQPTTQSYGQNGRKESLTGKDDKGEKSKETAKNTQTNSYIVGTAIGLTLAVIAAILLTALFVWWCTKKRKNRIGSRNSSPRQSLLSNRRRPSSITPYIH